MMRFGALLALAGCGLFLGSEEQLTLVLQALERQPPSVLVREGETLRVDRLALKRQVRQIDGDTATVFAHAEAEGAFGATKVSAIGPERLRFAKRDGWRLDGPALAELGAIVALLSARGAALSSANAEAYAHLLDDAYSDRGVDRALAERRLRISLRGTIATHWLATAWYLRAERDTATVREEYELSIAPVGRAPIRGVALLRLVRRESGWKLAGGLY